MSIREPKWKTLRDRWLEVMVKFQKLGDEKLANMCLEQAVRVYRLRTEIEQKIINPLIPNKLL